MRRRLAYGVEIDPDFIALLEEKGIEVVAQDAVAHLAELEPGVVDGITARTSSSTSRRGGVGARRARLRRSSPRAECSSSRRPNPESLVAGSINFHRDLTHVRPIHPDTLAFLCESAGFSKVEIRRASPVPDERAASDDRATRTSTRSSSS